MWHITPVQGLAGSMSVSDQAVVEKHHWCPKAEDENDRRVSSRNSCLQGRNLLLVTQIVFDGYSTGCFLWLGINSFLLP
ncbi:transmembrane protein, putative [Medicago truncatula]|uniref:Transmembrane protein, putative n=1 Tax=Medicago truncatula TaxID=3880 RepID=G7INQ5_MEDTR|nr:transmembrane protein, putative [Medicago truncatula]